MADLKLTILPDLSKLKKELGRLNIGGKDNGKTGGGIGGAAKTGVGILAIVGILGTLVNNMESITGILSVIGGLINQLVAPFVPILIGLLKPTLVLLQDFMGKVLKVIAGGATFEEKLELFGISLGALLAIGAAFLAGLTGGLAAIVAILGAGLVAFGINLGKKLFEFVKSFDLGDVFSDLKSRFTNAWGILTILLSSAWNILKGVLSSTWNVLKSVFIKSWGFLKGLFTGIFGVFKNIFQFLVDGLKQGFNFVIDAIFNGVKNFANLFIKGLNGIISLINKVPGVNISRIRQFDTSGLSNTGRNTNTVINFNIEGSADVKTAQAAVQLMRGELNRRGAF